MNEIESMLAESNQWAKVIANDKESSVKHLTPAAVTGGLGCACGSFAQDEYG